MLKKMKRLFNLILLVFLFMNSTALVGVLANDDIINGREKIENPNKKGVLFTVENVNKNKIKVLICKLIKILIIK